MGNATMRPIMTRDELARHKVDSYGRDYSRSDDGYSDMEVETKRGWRAVSGWGRDGWDLGQWPYVVISHRRVEDQWQLLSTCEGDRDVYSFKSEADLHAATDYLFIWYGIGREYDEWAVEGLGPQWNEETSSYQTRDGLDAGTLRVPERFRGPFSWARCDAERAAEAKA